MSLPSVFAGNQAMQIKSGLIQHVTSNNEIRTTNLCWSIKEFGSVLALADSRTFSFDKSVTLTKHSCKCELILTVDTNLDDQEKGYRNCKLQVTLHAHSGKGTKFFIATILQDIHSKLPKLPELCGGKATVNLTPSCGHSTTFTLLRLKKPKESLAKPPTKTKEHYLSDYIFDNTLSIFVIFEELVDVEQNEDQPNFCKEFLLNYDVFAEMYEKKLLVDVVFTMPDKQILQAHSIVLAAVSPYFLTMFTTSSKKECQTYNVDLSGDNDMSFDIFKGFLDYIYRVRKIKEMKDMVKGLAILADKYSCSKLHKECENILCSSLNFESIASFLLISDHCNFQSLKQKALELAKPYGMDVLRYLNGFDEICKKPDLLKELISSLTS